MLVAEGHWRVEVIQTRVELVVAHPRAVGIERTGARAWVLRAVAEQRIQQRADVAVDDPHGRFPAGVERDVQRQARRSRGRERVDRVARSFALRRNDRITEAADDVETADRIWKRRRQQRRLAYRGA